MHRKAHLSWEDFEEIALKILQNAVLSGYHGKSQKMHDIPGIFQKIQLKVWHMFFLNFKNIISALKTFKLK